MPKKTSVLVQLYSSNTSCIAICLERDQVISRALINRMMDDGILLTLEEELELAWAVPVELLAGFHRSRALRAGTTAISIMNHTKAHVK